MPRMRITNTKATKAFEMSLIARRDELRNRIEQYRGELRIDADPDDEGAVALRNIERGLALTNLDRAMRTLREVEEALRRIESGNFGYCPTCGERISAARLHALPWARICVECAAGKEGDTRAYRRSGHGQVVAPLLNTEPSR